MSQLTHIPFAFVPSSHFGICFSQYRFAHGFSVHLCGHFLFTRNLPELRWRMHSPNPRHADMVEMNHRTRNTRGREYHCGAMQVDVRRGAGFLFPMAAGAVVGLVAYYATAIMYDAAFGADEYTAQDLVLYMGGRLVLAFAAALVAAALATVFANRKQTQRPLRPLRVGDLYAVLVAYVLLGALLFLFALPWIYAWASHIFLHSTEVKRNAGDTLKRINEWWAPKP